MTAVATAPSTALARPLKVLTPLIKENIESGNRAGMEYYKHAGAQLIEAQEGHFDGNSKGFYQWAEKNFRIKRAQTMTYMALAGEHADKPFRSLREMHRARGVLSEVNRPRSLAREWTAPVDAVAAKARDEQRRLAAQEALTAREERDAEAKLGLRLIDIGWKVLARELHPDKQGGSREAMARLNRERDRLKAHV